MQVKKIILCKQQKFRRWACNLSSRLAKLNHMTGLLYYSNHLPRRTHNTDLLHSLVRNSVPSKIWFPPIFLTVSENFPLSAPHFTQNSSPQTNLIISSLSPPTDTYRTPLIKNYLKSYLPLMPFSTANPIHSFRTCLLSVSMEALGRHQ